MSMPPEVTAVVTTHVRPVHVFDALASVRAETHNGLEIIVVDDGGEFTAPAEILDSEVRIVRSDSGAVGFCRGMRHMVRRPLF